MAHAIFAAEVKRRGIKARGISAGLTEMNGMLASREARLACDRHGTPMPQFISTHVSRVDAQGARRVFVMERSQLAQVAALCSVSQDRISLLGAFDPQKRNAEIDDPVGQDRGAFDRCYEQMRDCILHYLAVTHDFETPVQTTGSTAPPA